jgi:hypothetical protein
MLLELCLVLVSEISLGLDFKTANECLAQAENIETNSDNQIGMAM